MSHTPRHTRTKTCPYLLTFTAVSSEISASSLRMEDVNFLPSMRRHTGPSNW